MNFDYNSVALDETTILVICKRFDLLPAVHATFSKKRQVRFVKLKVDMAARRSTKQACQLYQRFLQICEQWPIDSSRHGRDLGSHIKENLETKFRDKQIEVF